MIDNARGRAGGPSPTRRLAAVLHSCRRRRRAVRAGGWSLGRIATVAALVVAGGVLLSLVVPPRYVEYGGGDEENYLANGVRQASQPLRNHLPGAGEIIDGSDPSYQFLPPEWRDLPEAEQRSLEASLLDAEGRMFRLLDLPPDADDGGAVVLDDGIARKKATVAEGRIRIAHDNLYTTFLAGLVVVDDGWLPFVANDILLIATGLFFGLFVLRVTERRWAGILGGAALVALPSMVEAARVTRTETFTGLLFIVFVWWTTHDGAETAWPGLLLAALWATRHEFIVPLVLYLAWAGLRRKDGGAAVVVATLAAAYLHPWGLAETGELFPASRDVFARLPTTPAWLLVPFFAALHWLGGDQSDRIDGWADRLRSWGTRPVVHRAFWTLLVVGAVVAELLRRSLDVREQGWFVLRGPRLETFEVFVDSIGLPLLILGIAGLVGVGWKLAGRVPFIVALVTLPHAYVLVRMGASGADLWAWSRRLHVVAYPLLVLGLLLLLVHVAGRVDKDRVRTAAVGAVAAIALVPMLMLHADRPEGDSPTREQADGFHEGVDRLADGAVVFLSPAFGSQKAQLPIRIHGDRWSFVVWDDDGAAAELRAALPCLQGRPFYTEDEIADVLEQAGARARGDEVVIPARYNEGPGRDIALREWVVEPVVESSSGGNPCEVDDGAPPGELLRPEG